MRKNELFSFQFGMRHLADQSATVQMNRICYIVAFNVKLKFKVPVVSALSIERKVL